MTQRNYQQAQVAGTAVDFTAADAAGDTVPPNSRGALMVRNGDTTAKTVTVVTPGNTRYGQADPDVPVTVAAGATALIGPFPQDLADPADGLVHVTYSAVTAVTVAAIAI